MQKKLLRSKAITILLHVSVWALLLLIPMLLGRNDPPPDGGGMPQQPAIDQGSFYFANLFSQIALIILFYLNAYFLVPRFLNKKKWILYVLMTVALVSSIIVLEMLIRFISVQQNMGPSPFGMIIPFSILILLTSAAYSYIRENIRNENIRKEKEAENMKTELSFLRSQISPHFMFNTLNNLVSLARKKSDLLEPALLKLSGLLQYMLYESDDEKISIQKETEYLHNYIDLQRLRFGDELVVKFSEDFSSDTALEIVPMILIPFVENAFKHGVVLIGNPEIDIRLSINDSSMLTFDVRNRFNSESLEEKDKCSGIGLNNVRRRLNLLYPNQFTLDIKQEKEWHVVNLSISLK